YRRRRNGVDRLVGPQPAQADSLAVIDRGAGNDPVIVIGKVLRHHHALPTAGGTADEIGAVCLAAVVGVDEMLGGSRREIDRTIGLVQPRLRIEEELAGGGKDLVLRSGVLAPA